jgi:4-hydroxy-tetrahydrodipicolinate synthase
MTKALFIAWCAVQPGFGALMKKVMNTTTFRGPEKLHGLMPVIPTPMNADESLDEAGFERLAAFTLGYPFCGVWALATAGEDENMPVDRRLEAARLFVKYLGGKTPLLVKTSEPGTRETIERTRQFADLGIDIAVIHFQHKMLSPAHQLRYFETVAEASPLPIFLYHNALRGGQLDMDAMLQLSRHPKIAGMKAGGSNLGEIGRLCLLSDPDFSVFTAGGGQLLAGLDLGAAGHMASPFLAFPELALAVYEHARSGRREQAMDAQRRIVAFLQRIPKLHNREVMAETKCVLEIRGVINRYVSEPFLSATDGQKAQIADLIEEMNLFNGE